MSPETEVRTHRVAFGDAWDFESVYEALHDFTRSYPFDGEKERDLVHITTGTHVAQICLFLLTESRHFPARLIQTSPPKRKSGNVAGKYTTIDLDPMRYDRIASRVVQDRQNDITYLKSGIATRNAAFNALIEQIKRVAMHSREPILLMGATGAGKSQLARRIHELKRTRNQLTGRFVEVNCATLRGDAALSTLFGHRKGAFTGATQDRPGLLREAHGGLLLLDEVGELGLDEQAMLLKAIEEKRFYPMGSDEEVGSDFQLICGTNSALHDAIADNRFREDLFERINLWTLEYPGLRDRIEDIAPNLDYELDRYAHENNQLVRMSTEARDRFLKFACSPDALWSGNFRDLNNAVVRMATLGPGGRITVQTVDDEIERLRHKWAPRHADACEPLLLEVLGPDAIESIDRFERHQLSDVIRVCRESRSMSDAGRTLFQASRQRKKSSNDCDRLRKYLARFDLTWDDAIVKH